VFLGLLRGRDFGAATTLGIIEYEELAFANLRLSDGLVCAAQKITQNERSAKSCLSTFAFILWRKFARTERKA